MALKWDRYDKLLIAIDTSSKTAFGSVNKGKSKWWSRLTSEPYTAGVPFSNEKAAKNYVEQRYKNNQSVGVQRSEPDNVVLQRGEEGQENPGRPARRRRKVVASVPKQERRAPARLHRRTKKRVR